MLRDLAIATQSQRLQGESLDVYLRALEPQDTPTLCEAIGRLMKSAEFFPPVAKILETCGTVRKESKADESEELYSRKEWLPKARAKVWLDHLKDLIEALHEGRPRPAPPEALDTRDVTYKCAECQDTRFIPACHCGRKDCNLCKYHYVKDCYCRPAREIAPSFKRQARAN